MKGKGYWITAVVIMMAFLAFLLLRGGGDTVVSVASVETRDISATFSAAGIVRGKSISLSSQIAGEVVAVLAEEGQRVSAGDVLIRLDDSELQASLQESTAAVRTARERVRQAQASRRSAQTEIEANVESARKSRDAAQAEMDRVRAGAKPEQIEQAQSMILRAQAVLDQTVRELERGRRLFAEGAISRAQVEQLETEKRVAEAELISAQRAKDTLVAAPTREELESAKAQVEIQEANLRAAEAARSRLSVIDAEVRVATAELDRSHANTDRVQRQLSNFEIVAPSDGVIARLDLEPGESVMPGVAIVDLTAEHATFVEIEIVDQDTEKVFVGQEVTVTSGSMPGREFKGVVQSIAPEIEIKQDAAVRIRVLRANVVVEDPEDVFRIGTELDVIGTGVTARNSLSIPSDAVFFAETSPAVWIVEAGVAKLRPIRVGYTSFEYTEVLEGLSAGDQVVIDGKDNLAEGQSVKIRED